MTDISRSTAGAAKAIKALPPTFTDLEERVIEIARQDPISSLRSRGPIARVLRSIFGLRTTTAMADRRLEALRRYVLATRTRTTLTPFRVAMVDAGFYSVHCDEIDSRAAAQFIGHRSHFMIRLRDLAIDTASKLWIGSELAESMVAALLVTYFDLPLVVSPRSWR